MKTVMAFGTFDFIHAGHLFLFEQARKYGDHLTIVVGRDVNVAKVKGEAPIHTEKERVRILKHIDLIDEVILGATQSKYELIGKRKPDVIVLGYDQVAFVDGLKVYCKEKKIDTKIVRVRPYAHARKSSLIKQALSI